jgi:hypothetical protein
MAVDESAGDVELVIAAEDQIKVEALSRWGREVACEGCVGLVVYLAAELSVFLEDLKSDDGDVAHFQLIICGMVKENMGKREDKEKRQKIA